MILEYIYVGCGQELLRASERVTEKIHKSMLHKYVYDTMSTIPRGKKCMMNVVINVLGPGIERNVYGHINERSYKNLRAYEPDGVCARDCVRGDDGFPLGDAVEAPVSAVPPFGMFIGCCISSAFA